MNQDNKTSGFFQRGVRLFVLCALCLVSALAFAGCTNKKAEGDKPSDSVTVTFKPAAIIVVDPTATPTPVPTATPTPTPSPTPAPTGLLLDRFTEKFVSSSEHALRSKDEYRSDKLNLGVTRIYDKDSYSKYITYFVIDIYLQDIECLRTAGSGKNGTFSSGDIRRIVSIADDVGALVAINGDYYSANGSDGLVIRNGELLRNKLGGFNDICVLFRDGSMKIYNRKEIDVDAVMEQGAWQAWNFGPGLFDEEGNPRTEFSGYGGIKASNPRTMIGYYEPGHYCFVVVDGRRTGYSRGLSLEDLAQLAKDLGCVEAYNLDGGRSTQLCWNGEIYNRPYQGGRSVSDIVYITDP